jgi:RNA exonuclease 1
MDDEDQSWTIAESKKSRAKRRKIERQDISPEGPSISFPKQKPKQIELKALQELALYVLADGIAPTWLAVRNKRSIEKVVVLMVPGLDRDMLEDEALWRDVEGVAEDEKAGYSSNSDEDNPDDLQRHDLPDTDQADDSPRKNEIEPQSRTPRQRLLQHVIEVRAPGDSKTSRVHSPLQTMLIAPFQQSTKQSNGRGKDESVRTSITTFIHTAEQLRDAEYPIHPVLFTNTLDANMEAQRRNNTGQSTAHGWVDTDVSVSTPTTPSSLKFRDTITQGLKPYALDCEMVLTTDDKYSLARVSLLNWVGKTVLDKYVKPSLPIKNYFTEFSGITPEILYNVNTTLQEVQTELLNILGADALLLGHSLESDLCALKLTHPFVIDTSIIYPHPRGLPLRSSLKFLANKHLRREIQKGGAKGHDSVEDARAVLDLIKLKCDKGPAFGTLEANGESIFRRIGGCLKVDEIYGGMMLKTSAIVEYGTPERGLGKEATYHISCKDDDEIVEGVLRAVMGDVADDESKAVGVKGGTNSEQHEQGNTSENDPGEEATANRIPPGGVDFIWSRLRDLETVRGWNSLPSKAFSARPTSTTAPPQSTKLHQTQIRTISHVLRVFTSLPERTLFILLSGTNDMRSLLKLQDMQAQYRREFKVKKWDELSVKWTDREEQDMRQACDVARRGVGILAVT